VLFSAVESRGGVSSQYLYPSLLTTAVLSLAAATGLPSTFELDFLVDFFDGLLLIRDFFVMAIVVSPRNWI
jgi:hypothetical protein